MYSAAWPQYIRDVVRGQRRTIKKYDRIAIPRCWAGAIRPAITQLAGEGDLSSLRAFGLVPGLRKPRDAIASILERYEVATAR